MKLKLIGVMLLLVTVSYAQQHNILLQNDFWKSKPTAAQVAAKVKEGHSATEKNSRAFDATATAILADAPFESIKYLIDLDEVQVDTRTHDGRTYLIWAAYKGNLPVVKYLIKQGADVNAVGAHGYNSINFAAYAGITDTKLYDALLNNGANIHDTNGSGATALLLIMQYVDDLRIINYFELKGLKIDAVDTNGDNAFSYAARGGNLPAMQYLLKHGVSAKEINKAGENAIMVAAHGTRRGTPAKAVFEFLAEEGIAVNTTNNNGETPLVLVSGANKDVSLMQFFVAKGVDANAADSNGNTALLRAAQRNTLEVVTYLASVTNTINAVNADGQTALMRAVAGNSKEVVAFLLSKGAKIDVADKEGRNLLYYWANAGMGRSAEPDMAKLKELTKYGFDVAKAQPNGNNLWHIGVIAHNIAILELAAASEISVNAKNKEGYTPLLLAALHAKDTQILSYLVKLGADTAITTEFEETVYDLASENEALMKRNATIDFLK